MASSPVFSVITVTSLLWSVWQRAQKKVDKYRKGYVAPSLRHAFLPAIVSTSGRIHGGMLRLIIGYSSFLPTKRLPVPSRPWARPWMSTLRFTAGVGVGSSGACTIGPMPKHQRFWVLLCAPTGCSLAISFLFSLLFLLVCVALQLKSRSLLRYHTPRLCRIAVFSIQAIVLSDHDQWGLGSADSVSGGSSNHLHHRSDHVLCLPSSVAARPREMAIQSKPKPGAPRLLLATSIDVRPAPP